MDWSFLGGIYMNAGRLWLFLALLAVACAGGWLFFSKGGESVDIPVSVSDNQLSSSAPPFLLDVREPSEFEQARITGATLIPLGILPSRLDALPKDRPIVVYCRSGRRSAHAVSFLREKGFTNVQNLTGGMNAWLATHSCDAKTKTC
jgi:rhodanese-related sulfurtransferase